MLGERPGDAAGDAREHVLERDDLGEGGEADLAQRRRRAADRPRRARRSSSAWASSAASRGAEAGALQKDPAADQDAAGPRPRRAPALRADCVEVGCRGGRGERIEEREQLRRPEVRARHVLDERVVLAGRARCHSPGPGILRIPSGSQLAARRAISIVDRSVPWPLSMSSSLPGEIVHGACHRSATRNGKLFQRLGSFARGSW